MVVFRSFSESWPSTHRECRRLQAASFLLTTRDREASKMFWSNDLLKVIKSFLREDEVQSLRWRFKGDDAEDARGAARKKFSGGETSLEHLHCWTFSGEPTHWRSFSGGSLERLPHRSPHRSPHHAVCEFLSFRMEIFEWNSPQRCGRPGDELIKSKKLRAPGLWTHYRVWLIIREESDFYLKTKFDFMLVVCTADGLAVSHTVWDWPFSRTFSKFSRSF